MMGIPKLETFDDLEAFNASLDPREKAVNDALQRLALYIMFTEEQQGVLAPADVLILANTAQKTVDVLLEEIRNIHLEITPPGGAA